MMGLQCAVELHCAMDLHCAMELHSSYLVLFWTSTIITVILEGLQFSMQMLYSVIQYYFAS